MKLISHRGNIDKRNPDNENVPSYIAEALDRGFDVEIDIWLVGDDWFLGHDEPLYKVDYSFIENPKFWCHAKNNEALFTLKEHKNINCFWHDKDLYTLTSHGYIWCNIDVPLLKNSICVIPEKGINGDIKSCYGICSDFIIQYQNL